LNFQDILICKNLTQVSVPQPQERQSIASELDNQRIFTPLNGSIAGSTTGAIETNVDYVTEGSVKYGMAGVKLGKDNIKYNKAGSINGGYVPSDNEMVYGYAPPASVRSNRGYAGGSTRAAPRPGVNRPPSSLRREEI